MFGPFERAVAGRYLRARRGERFVSIIAGFSLRRHRLGRRHPDHRDERDGRLQGRTAQPHPGPQRPSRRLCDAGSQLTNYEALADQDPRHAGRGLGGAGGGWPGAVHHRARRRIRRPRARDEPGGSAGAARRSATHIIAGSLDDFKGDDAVAIGVGLAQQFGLAIGGQLTLVSPGRRRDSVRHGAAREEAYKVVAIFQVGMNELRHQLCVPAAAGGAGVLPEAGRGDRDRGPGRRSAAGGASGRGPSAGARGVPVRMRGLAHSNDSFFTAVQVRAERDVRDPDADHPGGRVQRDLQPDHDGEGQDARHRGAAHDRRRRAAR